MKEECEKQQSTLKSQKDRFATYQDKIAEKDQSLKQSRIEIESLEEKFMKKQSEIIELTQKQLERIELLQKSHSSELDHLKSQH